MMYTSSWKVFQNIVINNGVKLLITPRLSVGKKKSTTKVEAVLITTSYSLTVNRFHLVCEFSVF